MMKLVLSVLMIIALGFGVCHAEGLLMGEIEVKAKKEAEVESLEVREVRESNAKDTGEALQNIDGVWRLRKGGIANDVVIRGLQRDNINVLIDGARVYGACPNRMDPPAFHHDFAEVDTIDVLKGGFDIRNQGSLGGLVDVKTKSAQEGLHGEANLSYGSFNSFSGSAFASYGSPTFDILGGGAYKYSEPYEDGDGARFTEIYPSTSPNRYRDSEKDGPAYNILTGWMKLGVNPLKNHRLELSYTRQDANDVLYPYLLMDANYDDTDRFNMVYSITGLSDAVKALRVQAYWNQVKHDMTDEKRCSSTANPGTCSGDLPRSYSMRTFATTETTGARADVRLGVFGETNVGVEYYFRNWDATTTLGSKPGTTFMYVDQASMPDVDTQNVGIYVEQKNDLAKNLNLTLALRLDTTKMDAGIDRTVLYDQYYPGSQTSTTDTYPSGNLQLSYNVTETLNLFLGIAHTVRVPDPEERYFALARQGTTDKPDWVGNPGLKPVKNNEADLGIKYYSGVVLLKGTLFYSDLSDYVTVQNVFNGTRYAQTYAGVDAKMYGGELSARVSLPNNFYASAGASYVRGKNSTDDSDLAEIPPLKARVGLRYDTGVYFGEIEGLFSATQNKVDEALNETKTSGWGIANFRAGYSYKGLRILAGVTNIFDHQYSEYLSYYRNPFRSGVKVPEPGRSFYANVQFQF